MKPEDREWVPSGEQSLFLDAEDAETGVVSARIEIDGRVVKAGETSQDCSSGGCALSHDFLIDTDDVDTAEGAQPLSDSSHQAVLVVRDAAGNEARVPWTIRQERTPPELVLSGPLRVAAGQTLAPESSYRLDARATEAVSSPAQSGMGTIEFALDENEPDDAEEQDCPNGGCALTRNYDYATGESPGGSHTLVVTATDRVGNETTETVAFGDPAVEEPQCDPALPATPVVNTQPMTSTFAVEQFRGSTGLPEAFVPSVLLDINGQLLQPRLDDAGSEFVARGVIPDVRVDKGAADGSTITLSDDEAGPICLTPTTVSLGADPPTTPIAGATTVLANSRPGTDTAVRPSVTGVDQFLQLRGVGAPEQFAWNVEMQPGLELRTLEDGSVAVVRPAGPDDEATGMLDPPPVPGATERKSAIADTDLRLTQGEDDRTREQSSTADDIFAVFRVSGEDGQDGPVATSLSHSGSTLTMTVPHGLTSAYPVIAGLGFTSAEAVDDGATARADSQTADWTEADEASFDEAAPPPSEPLPADPDGDDSQTTGEVLAGDIPDVSSAAEIDTGGPDGEEVDPETTPRRPTRRRRLTRRRLLPERAKLMWA